jgi:1-phosphatidylinositol-4-phosphate 5-kinase
MAMYFGPRKRNLLLSQLKKDVELLSSLNIMDYSLLVGVHDVSRGNSENIRGNTLSVYQPKLPPVRTPSKKGNEGPPPLKRLATNLPTEEFLERKMGFFTSEDGGLFATNSHDEPTGDYVYYFGVIDLLTTVSPCSLFGVANKVYSTDRESI